MPPTREPDFVFLAREEAAELIASVPTFNPSWTFERLVRRRPPTFEPEDVVKLPRFLLEQAIEAEKSPSARR